MTVSVQTKSINKSKIWNEDTLLIVKVSDKMTSTVLSKLEFCLQRCDVTKRMNYEDVFEFFKKSSNDDKV